MKKKKKKQTVEKIHSSIEEYRKSEIKREEGNNGNISHTEGTCFLQLLQILLIQSNLKMFEGTTIN